MTFQIIIGDVRQKLSELETESIQTCVTSPPYWGLRDYGQDDQIGLETTPEEYISKMVEVFRQVRRILKNNGTFWLNIGDSYSGSGKGTAGNLGKKNNERHLEHKTGGIIPEGTKPKDLIGIPWMLAFALRSDGWYLRQDIIWAKPNVMPESVKDRCTKSHEYLFLLTKSPKYYFDNIAIKEPAVASRKSGNKIPQKGHGTKGFEIRNGLFEAQQKIYETRNKRDVWFIPPASFKGAHFAVMPEKLVEPCILAGSKINDTVLDPFTGSGTVGVVALKHQRNFVGIELNPEYAKMAENRMNGSKICLF